MLHLYFLLTRPLTIGVRAAIRMRDGKFVLVRHTYTPGWHFPGGGLAKNEVAREALLREVEQELGIQIRSELALLGLYFNRAVSKRDHVLLFHCRYDGDLPVKSPSYEIAEIAAFDSDRLPEDMDPGTARRIREIAFGETAQPEW
ncbi:MAG: NUDIX domain-containing protein [Proteobacteria bacterium]|nr:NUDIX domain-containing protein [Pseudomonadota bacterium]